MKLTKRNQGFTLIELLIVIGVLGILASGLLAAVDPFEQLKKGRDSNRRNIVVELHNSMIRYYATHGSLPWDVAGSACDPTLVRASGSDVNSPVSALTDCVDMVIADGELKTDFMVALGTDADKIFVSSPSTVSLSACFSPESKSLFNDAATRYDEFGNNVSGTGEACETAAKVALTPGLTCHWCAK